MFYVAHVLWRHRRTQGLALPPKIVQRLVFPLILLLGTALGKYRGTAWPGSPASCTGAPETVTRAPQPGGEHSESVMTARPESRECRARKCHTDSAQSQAAPNGAKGQRRLRVG